MPAAESTAKCYTHSIRQERESGNPCNEDQVFQHSHAVHRLQITTLQSLNDALSGINMQVTAAEEGPLANVDWVVRDGRSLFRFHDDMVRRALVGI